MKVLKNDNKAVFTAAAQAQRAVDFLHSKQAQKLAAEAASSFSGLEGAI